MFQIVGNIVDSLNWVNYLTIFGYWEPSEMLFGSGFNILDPLVLIGVIMALSTGAWIYFRKRDLPA
jgi:ABC-2 type transport system permease protein